MHSLKLRKGVDLHTEEGRARLIDHETGRRFDIAAREVPLVRALVEGIEPARLDSLRSEARLDISLSEYVRIYESLRLLDDGAAPREVRRRLRSDWDAESLARLQSVVAYARSTIPFYRDAYAELPEGAPRSLSELQELPLLTRDVYRRNFPDRLLPSGTSWLEIANDPNFRIKLSAGTTAAERMQVVQRVEYLMRVYSSSYHRDNLFDERHAIFGPLRCMEMDCYTEIPSFEQRYLGDVLLMATLDAMAIGEDGAARLLGELTTTGITNVVANPFYLALATVLARRVSADALPRIKTLHLGYDYVQATTRAFLEASYGCPARDIFGMTEGGYQLMRSCPEGRVHLNEEFFLFELEPVAGFERSPTHRLVFTTLANDFSPMIRYVTSDLFSWDAERSLECTCNSPLRHIEHFDGREKDILRVGNEAVTFGALDRAVGAIEGIAMYRLVVGHGRLEVSYLDATASPPSASELRDQVRARFERALEQLLPEAGLTVVARPTDRFQLGRSGKFVGIEYTE